MHGSTKNEPGEMTETRRDREAFSHGASATFGAPSTNGRCLAVSHHGEILQGVFEKPRGRLHRGLVSLKCGLFWSEATFWPDATDVLVVDPPSKVKARRAAELTLARFAVDGCGGRLKIQSNIPQCWGLGSSTADVTAAMRALSHTLGFRLSPEVAAHLAVRAEVASNSTMLGDHAVLFAHREGLVLEDFGQALPPLEVLGFNTDPTEAGIDTLDFPPARYTWWEVEAFRPLLGLLRRAVATQDAPLVGYVASASARLNQRYLPKPYFDDLEKLVERVGALGLQVAHSGTIVGLLFDPGDPDLEARIAEAEAALATWRLGPTWRFRSPSS